MAFITYSEKTMNKVLVIEKLINNHIDVDGAMEVLNCSERTIYRMKNRYKKYWPPWLIHWLKNKPSNHQWDNTKYWDIRNIIRKHPKYHDFWPTLFREHLAEDFWIDINKETLRTIMIKEGTWIAKPKKRKIIHQQRERRAKYGDLVQFDWSYHDRFETGKQCCLLCAVDDATSKVFLKFCKWESLEDVFNFWNEYFELFWKPQAIYVDCHATYKVNSPEDYRDKKKRTRFSSWMAKLWVAVIYSKIPEWKWRVEKWNQTHQDRLVKKMRLKWIKTMEDGNRYLEELYIKQHNEKFSIPAREEWNTHEKLTDVERKNLLWYFAKSTARTVKRDGTVRYFNTIYQLPKWLVLKSNRIIVKENMNLDIKLFDWADELSFTCR